MFSIHATIKAYLTSTTHHKKPMNLSTCTKTPNTITLYYNKAKLNRPLTHALNAPEIGDKPTLFQLCHQALNIISIPLLQRVRNVQHIAHDLVYHQTTKSILSFQPTPPRARIPKPNEKKFHHRARRPSFYIYPTSHHCLPRLPHPAPPRQCNHPQCTLTARLNRTPGKVQDKNTRCQ